MKAAFRLTLALIATFGASGCRTAGLSPSARPSPLRAPEPKLTFQLDDFIDEHNRNAERIESLTSKASISAKMVSPETGEPMTRGISGRVSMLRPKNFKLELASPMQTVADIGSNGDRFWFWLDNSNAAAENKHVYFCDYEDLPSANLAGTYQPDWIVDALGLRPITPDEAAAVRVSPGSKPGTTTLTFPSARTGSSYSRLMVVSDVSRRVVEYRVLDQSGKKLIGQATIKEYSDIDLQEDAADGVVVEPRQCHIPNRIVFEWKAEQLTLDILMKEISINRPFSAKMKANFVEPTRKGYTPLDLAEASRNRPRDESEATAVRETLPAPEPRNRVRLGPPEGAERDPETRRIATPARAKPAVRRSEAQPAATIAPLLMPILDQDVVGAVPPRAPGSPRQTADASYNSSGLTLER